MTETVSNQHSSKKPNVCLHGWQINDLDQDVKVTPVGVGVQLAPRLPASIDVAGLGDFLALIKEIALESDLLMPLIVSLVMNDRSHENCIELLRECRRQQAFHRGKFLLLPIKVEQDSNEILDALLNPKAEDIYSFEPPQPIDLARFWAHLEKDTSLSGYFEDQIRAALKWEPVPDIISPKEQKEFWVKVWEQLFKNPEVQHHLGRDQVLPTSHVKSLQKPDSVCTRITSAQIQNFKGIKDTKEIDLDADIVLLTGANGNGKSSFVKALTFALTGYHPDWNPPESIDHFFFSGNHADEFRIILQTKLSSLEPEQASQTACDTIRFGKQRQAGAEESVVDNHLNILRLASIKDEEVYVPVDDLLHFRLTSYLPDHVDKIFEENIDPGVPAAEDEDRELSHCQEPDDQVNLLRHLFPALAPEIEALCAVVHQEMGKINDELDKIKTKIEGLENFSDRFADIANFFTELQEIIQELPVPGAREWSINAGWQEMPPDVPTYLDLLDKERKSLENLFSTTLTSWTRLPDMIRIYRDAMPDASRQQREIHELEREISQIRQKIRELEAKFDQREVHAEELTKLREFCSFLISDQQAIIEELERFSGHGGSDLAREVKLVDENKLKEAVNILTGILGKYREKIHNELLETKEIQRRKEKKLAALSQQYIDAEAFARAEEFLDAGDWRHLLSVLDNDDQGHSDEYNKWLDERTSLTKKRDFLAKLSDFIENQRTAAVLETESVAGQPHTLHGAVEKILNMVLRRFVMAGGLDQIEVTEQYRLKADVSQQDEDKKRGLLCFSSGQRAQVGMAWMVAVRELMQNEKNRRIIHFPHRIIIMDDPSTTFDITNLLSQAILWRQLAYNEDPTRRYQVFIVSHHEEFSSHLLDLLCPPPGCSMRLVRFVDWNPDNGAKIKTFDVEPSPAALQRSGTPAQTSDDGLEGARRAFKDGLSRIKEMVV